MLLSQKLVASDDVPDKKDGIQDKSSLDDEHDLMKTESQDVATEHKPLYQVHQVSCQCPLSARRTRLPDH